ncbi:MAG: GTPase Era [Eubacteriales bacterium]|nr:GTPase Era [Eubacteriales bacterium]
MSIKKAGFATIIGRPNVGKSTLMNHLIGQKIAITSYKPQTTRTQIRTILTNDDGQVVFLDTPGIHAAKTRMGEYMVRAAESTLKEVDVILWLVEPREKISREDSLVMEQLVKVSTPVLLVINKMDTVKKAQALPVIAAYRKAYDEAFAAAWPDGGSSDEGGSGKDKSNGSSSDKGGSRRRVSNLKAILPVSARKGDGTKELLKELFDLLPEGEPFYDEEEITTQTEREIAAEIIREKALRLLQEEVPHGIAVTIERMKERTRKDGTLICDIDASIICERESHKLIVIGRKGEMLKKIGTAAREDIEKMLQCKVALKLWVKVRKDWKDNELQMKNFGYDMRTYR